MILARITALRETSLFTFALRSKSSKKCLASPSAHPLLQGEGDDYSYYNYLLASYGPTPIVITTY
jgi:hypothetical protein